MIMIDKLEARSATPAEQLMAIDVFAQLLASTDPAQLGKNLTEQLRELTGAQTVMLISHADKPELHRLIHASPPRRSNLFSGDEFNLFCISSSHSEMPRKTEDFPADHPLRTVLERSGIASMLSFPLAGEGNLVGTVLLFNLPGLDRVEETAAIVKHLSPVIALALKNSLSHERIEKQAAELKLLTEKLEIRVAERTAELEESNLNLNRSLEEKETLIRELYHRTNNTLQVIKGILKLQAEKFPENTEVNELVEVTANRIQAISLVHQMLYNSKDLSHIPIKEYIHELIGSYIKNTETAVDRISLSLEIDDYFFLLDSAIPLGLIITELISNSLKHAFPENKSGTISITLTLEDSDYATLRYSDNGIGFPDGFDIAQQTTLGLNLIGSIGEDQMLGTVCFNCANGMSFTLRFPKILHRKRV